MIVAEKVHTFLFEGCTARFDKNHLHAAVVELSRLRCEIKYATANWYAGDEEGVGVL